MDAAWVLGPIAALMALTIAALVRWSTGARTVVAAAVVVFLFVMMVAMFVATLIYFSSPGSRSLVLGLWIAAALMSVSVFPVLLVILRESAAHLREGRSYTPRRLVAPLGLALAVTVLVFLSEFLMGRSFALAAGSVGRGATGSPIALLSGTIASPWFLFPMALEMTLSLLWLRATLPAPLLAPLAAQAAMMFFSPPALSGTAWIVGSSVLASVAMTAALGFLVLEIRRRGRLGRAVRGYAVRFLWVTAVMALGLAAWAVGAGLGLFALGMVLEMGIFFSAIVVPETFRESAPAQRSEQTPRLPTDAPAPD